MHVSVCNAEKFSDILNKSNKTTCECQAVVPETDAAAPIPRISLEESDREHDETDSESKEPVTLPLDARTRGCEQSPEDLCDTRDDELSEIQDVTNTLPTVGPEVEDELSEQIDKVMNNYLTEQQQGTIEEINEYDAKGVYHPPLSEETLPKPEENPVIPVTERIKKLRGILNILPGSAESHGPDDFEEQALPREKYLGLFAKMMPSPVDFLAGNFSRHHEVVSDFIENGLRLLG